MGKHTVILIKYHYRNLYIMSVNKLKKIRYIGHVIRLLETSNAYTSIEWEPEVRRTRATCRPV